MKRLPLPASAARPPSRPARRRAAFTLIELMAVVGIIVLMSALVVGGFAGIQRALGTSDGASAFRRVLSLARQQACVDGVDVFVWCTGVDRYVVCRKAGVVSGNPKDGSLSVSRENPPYASRSGIDAYWVHDEYADLGVDAAGALAGGEDILSSENASDEAIAESFRESFKGTLVFDLTKRKLAKCAYPAFYKASEDAWLFGIAKKDYEGGTFLNGHAYGWTMLPEQTLPGGYAFKSSWDGDGNLLDSWADGAWVHFFPDGRAETGSSHPFTILEVGANNPYSQTVRVDGNGKITVSGT